jgi:polysaccharide export outer membrane protein
VNFWNSSIIRCAKLADLLSIAFLAFALCGSVSLSPAWADTPTPEQLQMLQKLTPEQMQQLQQMSPKQRAALMQQVGGDARQSANKPKEATPPPEVQPRQPGAGRLESEVKNSSTDERLSTQEVLGAPKAEVPVEQVKSQQAADKMEVRRSFEEFMREAKPLEVSTSGLQQFGYDLFASEPTTFAPVTDVPVPPEYVLGPGDEIKVQLFGKDNQVLALTVDREGAVSFPQIGPISVARLSFAQAKALLAEQIKQKMIGVSASITMGQLRSIRIFALGDVFRPGSYTVSGLATLSSALFASGGVKKIGSLRNIELKRNGRTVTTIDLYDFLLRGDTSKDVRLLPGDVVFVPPIGKTVAIAGEVVRPAIYEIKNEMTVSDILKLAGGLMPKAYLDKVLIERVDAKSEQKVINLSLLGNGSGTPVQSGDVIKVFAGTGFENNQILLIGNLKRPGKYAWESGMRVSSLIPSIDDLLPETFLEYGAIQREAEDTREPMMIRFKLGELLTPQAKGGALDLPLQARDRVYVFKRANFREQPTVSIVGSVQTPGGYEYIRNMRLADLVLAAGGVLREADLGFVEVYRTDPQTRGVQLIKTNLALAMAADGVNDILLQDLDRVVVHSIHERKERAQVSLLGEVHKPGTFDLGLSMRVSDLVIAGGNITEMAFLKNAEITRYSVENGLKRVSDHFTLNLAAALSGDAQANVLLQPYDVLYIGRVSNWRPAEQVVVDGEVIHPGTYPVEEGETLSSLLKRVGGFTDQAYLTAAVFTRESVRLEQQKQADELAQRMDAELSSRQVAVTALRDDILRAQQQQALEAGKRLLEKFKATQVTGRVVISLADMAKLEGTEFDVKLRSGDKLLVPKRPDEVLVVGEVYNHAAVWFNPDYSRDDYVQQAGPTRMADVSGVYLIRADGRVETGSGGWFSAHHGRIQPGDTIVVPQDLERMNMLDSVLDWSRATMQIGVSLAAMKTIGVFH